MNFRVVQNANWVCWLPFCKAGSLCPSRGVMGYLTKILLCFQDSRQNEVNIKYIFSRVRLKGMTRMRTALEGGGKNEHAENTRGEHEKI